MPHNRTRIALNGLDAPGVSRRVFLRGTLVGASAFGTGALALPAAAQYGGGGGAMPGGAAMPGPGPAPSRAGEGKMSKAAARYQARPNGNQRCGRCANFLAPTNCKVVAGSISPNAWCRHFKPAA
jgi:hypothetical protein